jgi:Amt family ammonium transporter
MTPWASGVMLVSAALVFFMMPGLALFYGGMVRAKNVLNMFLLVMVCVPLVAIEWVAYGYNMAFAVPSAIAVDAGKGPDGKDLPKHSYLGWDPGRGISWPHCAPTGRRVPSIEPCTPGA